MAADGQGQAAPPAGLSEGANLLGDFLAALPKQHIDRLYAEPAAPRFVFRHLLPPLAQQFAIRLLFFGKPVQTQVLQKWAAPGGAREGPLAAALAALERFHVLVEVNAAAAAPAAGGAASSTQRPGPRHLLLHKQFQAGLSQHLLRARSAEPPDSRPDDAVDEGALHRHAVDRWEALLRWLTAAAGAEPQGGAGPPPSAELRRACGRLGLLDTVGQLTPAGYRFVLNERQRQLWMLLLAFLEGLRAEGPSRHLAPLALALALSDLQIGQPLPPPRPGLPPDEAAAEAAFRTLLADVGAAAPGAGSVLLATPAALGLFRRDAAAALSRSLAGAGGRLSLPPHLYHSACRRAGELEGQVEEQGIIVESNFKVYAYTSGNLHACLLGLFCKMVTRLPNLVVAHLAAETALQAMKRGIRVENIISYLESTAHPRALARLDEGGALVPANVKNQLEVWESSRARTTAWRTTLFEWGADEFVAADFEAARRHAEEAGALLWASRPATAGPSGGAAPAGRPQDAAPAGQLAVLSTHAPSLRKFLAARRSGGAGRAPSA